MDPIIGNGKTAYFIDTIQVDLFTEVVKNTAVDLILIQAFYLEGTMKVFTNGCLWKKKIEIGS